jgi:DNA polymerase-3 subunit epsilon
MADAEMAANLTAHLAQELRHRHGLRELSHDLLCSLQKVSAAKVTEHLQRYR